MHPKADVVCLYFISNIKVYMAHVEYVGYLDLYRLAVKTTESTDKVQDQHWHLENNAVLGI